MDVAKYQSLSPTFEEMAERHRSVARNELYRFDVYGNSPKGRAAVKNAAAHRRIAVCLSYAQAEALAARDGLLSEFRSFVRTYGGGEKRGSLLFEFRRTFLKESPNA